MEMTTHRQNDLILEWGRAHGVQGRPTLANSAWNGEKKGRKKRKERRGEEKERREVHINRTFLASHGACEVVWLVGSDT